MSTILIDTSAWVDFLRGDRTARDRVAPVLEDRRAAMCGPIYAEVLSGATERTTYDRLKVLFRALTWLDSGEEHWTRAAEVRFQLARQGVQAHLIDLVIALTAAEHGIPLLSRDRDFERIEHVVPLDLILF